MLAWRTYGYQPSCSLTQLLMQLVRVCACVLRRYFAETSATLFTTILGQREGVDALGGPFRDYWLSDGTYGSFRIQVGHLADRQLSGFSHMLVMLCRVAWCGCANA